MPKRNHIKSPKQDTLRGIGKLGWSAKNAVYSNIKKLMSSFSIDKIYSNKNNKSLVICPICNKKFKLNNTTKIPDHKKNIYYFNNLNICEGSFSRQKSQNYSIISVNNLDGLKIGDKYLLDFTRAIWKEIDPNHNNLLESEIKHIDKVEYYRNDDSIYSTSRIIYFDKVKNPIKGYTAHLKHAIKL